MPTASVTLTRPNDTTAYTANDVLGAATGSTAALEFANVGKADGGPLLVRGASLFVRDTALIASEAAYRLHLYNITPPSALGDNAAWDLPAGDRAAYQGFVDISTPVDLGSSLWIEMGALAKPVQSLTGSLWAYLVTIAGYTPTALRVHDIKLHTETRL